MARAVLLGRRLNQLYAPYIIRTYVFNSAAAEAVADHFDNEPDNVRKALIDLTVGDLETLGAWPQYDVCYVTAAADPQAARTNWKTPGTRDLTESNSPTHEADRGYTGNGTSSRLLTGYIPSTHGVNWTQDDASLWLWSLTAAQNANRAIGSVTAPRAFIIPSASNNMSAGLNDSDATTRANTTSLGMFGVSRAAVGVKKYWKDGAQLGASISAASTALANQAQWMLGGAATQFTTLQEALGIWAGSLNGLEAAHYDIWHNYMQELGAAA